MIIWKLNRFTNWKIRIGLALKMASGNSVQANLKQIKADAGICQYGWSYWAKLVMILINPN